MNALDTALTGAVDFARDCLLNTVGGDNALPDPDQAAAAGLREALRARFVEE